MRWRPIWSWLAAGTAAATLAAPALANNPDESDRDALKTLKEAMAQLSGDGNLKPAFSTAAVIEKNDRGEFIAGVQTVLFDDGKGTAARTVLDGVDGYSYTILYDGLHTSQPHRAVSWTSDQGFPTRYGAKFTILTDGGPKQTLYVADIADTYPGFEWLAGPFVIIRQEGVDGVYAVWSTKLNWPVISPEWQVRGAVVGGKPLGQDYASLLNAAHAKAWPAELAKLDAARKAFASGPDGSHMRVADFKAKPTDLLPEYRAGAPRAKTEAIDDPEARIAASLAPYIADSTAVAGVETVVRSPAMWTVSKGHQSATIIGVPWLLDKDVQWSPIRLKNRLRESSLNVPPIMQDVPVKPLLGDEKVPDAERARLAKAAASIGEPPSRYADLNPLLAGYQLSADFRAKQGLQPELATSEILAVAGSIGRSASHQLPLTPPDPSESKVTPAAEEECLNAALDEVEAGKDAFEKAMQAWASGDVRTALTAPRGLEKCSFAFPFQAQLREQSIDKQVSAIEDDLRPAGSKGTFVVYLRALLSEDGVLARLQQAGYKIEAPKT